MTSTNIITMRHHKNADATVELNGREMLDVTSCVARQDGDEYVAIIVIRCAQFNDIHEADQSITPEENDYRVRVLRALEEGREIVWRFKTDNSGNWQTLKVGEQPAWDVMDYKVLS